MITSENIETVELEKLPFTKPIGKTSKKNFHFKKLDMHSNPRSKEEVTCKRC